MSIFPLKACNAFKIGEILLVKKDNLLSNEADEIIPSEQMRLLWLLEEAFEIIGKNKDVE